MVCQATAASSLYRVVLELLTLPFQRQVFALHAVVEVAPHLPRSPVFDTFFIESPQVGIPTSVLLEHDLQSNAYDPGLNIDEFQEGRFMLHLLPAHPRRCEVCRFKRHFQ